MVVFANCHGQRYIDIIRRDTNIESMFDIKYFVSYQNLNRFNEIKSYFESRYRIDQYDKKL